MVNFSSDAKADRAYNQPENSNSVDVINPEWARETSSTLASETNQTDGDYYYYIDCSGYRYHGVQLAVFDGGSGTISGSLAVSLDSSSSVSSATYSEASQDLILADYTTVPGIHLIDTPLPVKYLRVKVSCESGDDTCDYTIYHIAKY